MKKIIVLLFLIVGVLGFSKGYFSFTKESVDQKIEQEKSNMKFYTKGKDYYQYEYLNNNFVLTYDDKGFYKIKIFKSFDSNIQKMLIEKGAFLKAIKESSKVLEMPDATELIEKLSLEEDYTYTMDIKATEEIGDFIVKLSNYSNLFYGGRYITITIEKK